MEEIAQGESRALTFRSAIADWTEVNSSFDKGILKIAYHGANRNQMYISKQAFDDAIRTIYNCPVVCNYIRETDSIGSHDVDIVKKEGQVRMVNITTPVGVVPESANVWWSEVEEEDGKINEYLCSDILIWKRQEAYEHIKENGVTDESMEIKIYSGSKQEDGLFHVDKFEFLAFCLLESASPCFESAGIELFSLGDFQAKYSQMMEDVKREFSTVIPASADDIYTQTNSKGGICELNINELLSKYSLSAEDVTFDTTDMPIDELEKKFAEIKAGKDKAALFDEDGTEDEPGNENGSEDGTLDDEESADEPVTPSDESADEQVQGDDSDDAPVGKKRNYSLTEQQFISELYEALAAERYTDPYWGECSRYFYTDCDTTLGEVYAYDVKDWKLFGMPFSMNGDKVVVDFAKCKRKKVCYADFDEGTDESFASNGVSEFASMVQGKFKALTSELETLKAFKESADAKAHEEKVNEVFSNFADIANTDAFKALKANSASLSIEDVEERCFAIRGRSVSANFSLDHSEKPIRLPIESQTGKDADEPYNGVFAKYGIKTSK